MLIAVLQPEKFHLAWERPPIDRAAHRRTLRAACKTLRSGALASEEERESATEVINQWRMSHQFPLNTFQTTLRRHASRIGGSSALVVQRIKRLETIQDKLARFPDMDVDRMQDLGGCRAILSTMNEVTALAEKYAPRNDPKLWADGGVGIGKSFHQLVRTKNYIVEPKSSGYRSIHYIYRYQSSREEQRAWDGLQIEIQLRTQLQHAWAAAVETVDLFTGQREVVSIGV